VGSKIAATFLRHSVYKQRTSDEVIKGVRKLELSSAQFTAV